MYTLCTVQSETPPISTVATPTTESDNLVPLSPTYVSIDDLLIHVTPEAANFKKNCFGQVVLCCFVFLLRCVALPCLSKHLMDDLSHVKHTS